MRGFGLVVVAVTLGAASVGACAPADETSDQPADETVAGRAGERLGATVGGAGRARLGLGMTWQWQLTGEIDTSHDVDLYDVDLFEVPVATIDELHRAGRTVICYFSAGTVEDWRPDAADFPDASIGRGMEGWDGEYWLDVRLPAVLAIHEARLDLAVERGCDGVEPDNVVGYDDDTGFDLDRDDQLIFDRALADAAHDRGLFVALKNGPDLVADLVDSFDLAVTEQCHEYGECEAFLPFVEQGKPVLDAEYSSEWVDDEEARAVMCAESARLGIGTLVLPLDLDGSFRLAC